MNGSLKKFFSANSVTITIWTVGILFAALNLFISSQLVPLNQNITILATKVSALEVRSQDAVTQDQLGGVNMQLRSIQNTLNTIITTLATRNSN